MDKNHRGGDVMELFSIEAEQALIGGMLIGSVDAVEISESIQPEMFYDKFNQQVWSVIQDFLNNSIEFDFITVSEKIEGQNSFKRLAIIAKETIGSSNIKTYAGIVKHQAGRREVVRIGNKIIESANLPIEDEQLVERVQGLAMGVDDKAQSYNAATIKEVMRSCVDSFSDRINQGGGVYGLPTGFKCVDERVLGYRDGDFVVIAARPAMGKTVLALNIAEHNIAAGKTGIFFSLEMPKEQLIERMIASSGTCDYGQIRRGDADCLPAYTVGVGNLSLKNLTIYDKPSITTLELSRVARATAIKKGKLDFIIVDYMQLMTAPKSQNRTDEVGQISRALKRIAKEHKCPVIALSQLNRGLESRTDKRPKLSDLRESGDIEQDADIVQFIYRDEIYNKENTQYAGVAEIITAKFRAGEIGSDFLTTNFRFCRFEYLENYTAPETLVTTNRRKGFSA